MKRTLCERVAAPLLKMHRKTTPPAATVVLGLIGLAVAGYGLAVGNPHVAWGGALVTVVGWYGFLLSGCEKLLAAKERELKALQEERTRS
jgi:hypothetical protein